MPLGCLVDKDGKPIKVHTLTSIADNLDGQLALATASAMFGRVDGSNVWAMSFKRTRDAPLTDNIYLQPVIAQLQAQNSSDTWSNLKIDTLTNSLVGIDYAHHEIHQGNHYTVRRFVSLTGSGGATPQDDTFVIVGANKTLHIIIDVSCETEMRFNLYEATTVSGNGTNQTAYDNNRVTANTTDAAWYRNPTVSTDGTLLDTIYVGAGKNTGAQVSTRLEWILKKSTNYMFRVINLSATGGDFSMRLMYYEE